jgi:hypothetical protein
VPSGYETFIRYVVTCRSVVLQLNLAQRNPAKPRMPCRRIESSLDSFETGTIDDIDIAIEHRLSEVVLLRRMRNTRAAAINWLPAELLVEVASYLTPRYPWSRAPEERQRLRLFFGLSQVCSYWRQSMLSAPRLWSILPCRDPEKTRLMLERARGSPLSVSLWRIEMAGETPLQSRESLLQEMDMLLSHSSHLWNLSLILPLDELQSAFESCASRDAPILKWLDIICVSGPDFIPVVPAEFLAGATSCLVGLNLVSCSLDPTSPLLHNLKSLELKNLYSLSAHTLMRILANAPNLTELSLASALAESGAPHLDYTPVTMMPRLQTLHIVEADYNLHAVLQMLRGPELGFLSATAAHSSDVSTICRVLNSDLMRSILCPTPLEDPGARIRAEIYEGPGGSSYELILKLQSNVMGGEVNLELVPWENREPVLQELLRAIADAVVSWHPCTLRVAITDMDSDQWTEWFCAGSDTLHEIHVTYPYTGSSLVQALGCRVSSDIPDAQDLQQPPIALHRRLPFAFRGLKVLQLFNLDFTAVVAGTPIGEILKQNLAMRAAEGLILDSLTFYSYEGISHSGLMELREGCRGSVHVMEW